MAKIGNRDLKAVSLDSFFAIMSRHTRKVGVYMNNITIFNSPEFGDIRTELINGEVWFVGKDVAEALGYHNPQKALRDHVDDDDKLTERIVLSGQGREAILISESGVYALIFCSKLESAKRFKHWVTSEVLPAIRKTGSCSINERKPDSYMIEDPVERAKRWIEEQEEKQKLIETVQEQAPKAEYFDSLVNSNLLTNFRDTAKELGYSQTEFTEWLIAKGYVYKDSKGILKPYEIYRKQGLFQMKDFKNPYNHFTGTRTLVTVKGKNTFRLLMQVPD
jgi:prophage antirepressor-like protein